MAVQNKTKDTRLKTHKAPKTQGEPAATGELSADRKIPGSRTSDRGIGSSFAMAVGNVLEDAKMMKNGANKQFLGEKTDTLDPKVFAHSLIITNEKGE